MIEAGRRSNTWLTAVSIVERSTLSVPNVSTITRHRVGDADGVRNLHLGPGGEARGDDVLGDPAHRVGTGAVDLRRILAGECAAAVAGGTTVGVDDDLAAGETGVAHRSAGNEAAGRVDQHEAGLAQALVRTEMLGDHGEQDMLDDVRAHPLLVVDVGVVLGRDQQPLDRERDQPAPLLAVADGDLCLAVRPEVRHGLGPSSRASRAVILCASWIAMGIRSGVSSQA